MRPLGQEADEVKPEALKEWATPGSYDYHTPSEIAAFRHVGHEPSWWKRFMRALIEATAPK